MWPTEDPLQPMEAVVPKTVTIDVEPVDRHRSGKHWRWYLKAHRTASILRSNKAGPATSVDV